MPEIKKDPERKPFLLPVKDGYVVSEAIASFRRYPYYGNDTTYLELNDSGAEDGKSRRLEIDSSVGVLAEIFARHGYGVITPEELKELNEAEAAGQSAPAPQMK